MLAVGIFVPRIALAHCPLCTAGAGILAITAAYFGLSSMIIGVLIGAFALALSLWLKNWPRRQFIRYQRLLIGLLIFLGTVVPIMPLVVDYAPLYLPFWGEYGRTFAISLYLAGLPFGMAAVYLAPALSRLIARARGGKIMPYQGMAITFILLVIISILIQMWS
jgi:hypothetical protein